MPATGTYPALAVQFAPGIAASAVPSSGDWVDITTYVDSLQIKYGREDEFTQPSAGSVHLELDNGYRSDVAGAAYQAAGRFDPDNTASPWATMLLPLVWFRVLGGTTTATTDVFYGQVSIEGWRLSASQFAHSIVSIDVLDMFEQMANTDLPASVYEIEVRSDSPRAWYRLGESSGTTAIDSSGNAHDGTYEGSATFNTRSGLIALASDNAIYFPYDGVTGLRLTALPLSYPFTIEAWVQTADAASASTTSTFSASRVLVDIEGGGLEWLRLFVIADDDSLHPGTVAIEVSHGATDFLAHSSGQVNDGAAHHVVVVGTNSTTDLSVWVDGVDVTSSVSRTGASWPAPIATDAFIGSGLNTVFGGFGGILDEVAFYSSALSGSRIAAHYEAGSAPWYGELSGARISHLLDAAGFPSSLRTIATGTSAVQSASTETDLLSALQSVAKAERGELYIDHANGGKVRFRGRQDRWTATASVTSQATFGDGGGSEVPYKSIDIQDDRIINRATMSRAGGSAVLVHDATSETTYQRRTFSESGLLFETDAEALSRAALVVAEKKDRKRRVRSLVLEPRGTAHLAWPQVFARTIGDRVTVNWRPPYGGTYTYQCWIEGVAHEWTQKDAAWRTTFNLSPVPFSSTGTTYWILGTSVLGTDTRPGY